MIRQLLNWFRRGHLESDLDRELKYHIDHRTKDLMVSGLAEPEARRQANLEIGGVSHIREEVRDVWLSRWLRDFVYDLRFSIRSFLHSPSFTAAAVLSLALGIGATTAIYSLVDQVVLHALPVREPGRLVLIDWNGSKACSAGRKPLSVFQRVENMHRLPRKLSPVLIFRCWECGPLSVGYLPTTTTRRRAQVPLLCFRTISGKHSLPAPRMLWAARCSSIVTP